MLAGVLAAVLALGPAVAFASAGDEVAEETEAAESADEAAEYTTVTVYYCEIVHYDDPSFDHPSGMRLMDVVTYDGAKVGETINEWDYVRSIPDFQFFDGWATNKVISADPEKNTVQLHYFRVKSPATVNYYAVSAAKDAPLPVAGRNALVDDAPAPAQFEKMGSYEIESQPLGTRIDASMLAVPLDDLVYLDADKESITVEALASNNEINLFYTVAAVTLPDDVEAGYAPDVTEIEDSGAGSDDESAGDDGAGAPGGEASDGATGAGDNAANEEDAPDAEETVIADDGAPLAAAAETGVLALPQTGDEVVVGALLLSAAVAAGGATLLARRRQ